MSNFMENEVKSTLNTFKKSYKDWCTNVSDLSIKDYNESDDLMEPEAYDEIRNYIIQQFEENNFNNNSCYNIIKQMPYMTNWEIDSYLTHILKINMPPELKNIVYKYMPPTVLAFGNLKIISIFLFLIVHLMINKLC